MQIKLDLLKFHYFNKSKKLNNLTCKEYESYLYGLFFTELLDVLRLVVTCKNCGNLENCATHFHKFGNDVKYTIIDEVIKTEHPSLHSDIFQILGEITINDIKLYQCKLRKRERLIFIIYQSYGSDKWIFAPILFDLKHCFYIKDDKSYDDNKCNEKTEWNLKDRQKEIVYQLQEKLGISKTNN